jgi:hypothetical protein
VEKISYKMLAFALDGELIQEAARGTEKHGGELCHARTIPKKE